MRRTHELLTSHPGPACFVSLAHPRTFSDTSSAPISITGLGSRRKSAVQPLAVNADSIFPTCAEVKFRSWRVPVISRLGDRLLHALVADRGGAAVVVGLAR